MNRNFLRVALAGIAAAALVGPASADHSWGPYHWAGSGRALGLTINSAVTPQWEASLGKAVADWDSSKELDLTRNAVGGIKTKACNPIAGQILVCNDAYGRRGWLGIASIWLSNGHISQGTTKLNDSYHDAAPYNSPEWRSLVMCQEIGHDFGLDHQDEAFDNPNLGTCMDYTSNPAGPPPNTAPNAHDYEQLSIMYDHDDGFTTATAGPRSAGASADVGDSPAEWGRVVHVDRYGRPDKFEKQLGPNDKVLTHVFWAVGEGPRR